MSKNLKETFCLTGFVGARLRLSASAGEVSFGDGNNVFVVAVEFVSDSFSKLPSIGAIAKILLRFGSASITSFDRFAKSKSESRLKLGELKSDSLDESSDCGESGRESVVSRRGSIPVENDNKICILFNHFNLIQMK